MVYYNVELNIDKRESECAWKFPLTAILDSRRGGWRNRCIGGWDMEKEHAGGGAPASPGAPSRSSRLATEEFGHLRMKEPGETAPGASESCTPLFIPLSYPSTEEVIPTSQNFGTEIRESLHDALPVEESEGATAHATTAPTATSSGGTVTAVALAEDQSDDNVVFVHTSRFTAGTSSSPSSMDPAATSPAPSLASAIPTVMHVAAPCASVEDELIAEFLRYTDVTLAPGISHPLADVIHRARESGDRVQLLQTALLWSGTSSFTSWRTTKFLFYDENGRKLSPEEQQRRKLHVNQREKRQREKSVDATEDATTARTSATCSGGSTSAAAVAEDQGDDDDDDVVFVHTARSTVNTSSAPASTSPAAASPAPSLASLIPNVPYAAAPSTLVEDRLLAEFLRYVDVALAPGVSHPLADAIHIARESGDRITLLHTALQWSRTASFTSWRTTKFLFYDENGRKLSPEEQLRRRSHFNQREGRQREEAHILQRQAASSAAAKKEYEGDMPGNVTLMLISNTHFTARVRKPVDLRVTGYLKLTEGATYDRQAGRWRFPLSSHDSLYSALCNIPGVRVTGIPKSAMAAISLGLDGAQDAQNSEGGDGLDEIKQALPPGLFSVMSPFQREGVKFVISKDGRALIGDEMGLGKTIQAIACAAVYRENWPLLIISPSSARFHWEHELKKWLGEDYFLPVSPCHANASEVTEAPAANSLADTPSSHGGDDDDEDEEFLMDECDSVEGEEEEVVAGKGKGKEKGKGKCKGRESGIFVACSSKAPIPASACVVITSYDLVNRTKENLYARKFGVVIADECHYLKNEKAHRTKAIAPLISNAARAILLSGTPALSRPMELYSQLNMLRPDLWKDRHDFGVRYCAGKRGAFGWDFSGASNIQELHALLRHSVMVRRLKKDVLTGLPPKQRTLVEVAVVDEDARRRLREDLDLLSQQTSRLAKLSKRARQQEASNDTEEQPARLVKERRALLMQLYVHTGRSKIPAAVQHLDAMLGDELGGKLVIFAHHREVLDAIEEQCLSRKKFKYVRIDGRTLARKRQASVVSFQEDPSIRVALLGLTAAGVGITLTTASKVVFIELYWTPAQLLQAEDRCHRIGQASTVRVQYLIARDTLDDALWPLVREKIKLLGEMVEGTADADMDIQTTSSHALQTESNKRAAEILTWSELQPAVANDARELSRAEKKMENRPVADEDDEDDDYDSEDDYAAGMELEELGEGDAGGAQEIFQVFDDEDEELLQALAPVRAPTPAPARSFDDAIIDLISSDEEDGTAAEIIGGNDCQGDFVPRTLQAGRNDPTLVVDD
jgi:hypothetical protein